MAYTQEENEKYQPPELEPRPQQPIDKIEILFDKVASIAYNNLELPSKKKKGKGMMSPNGSIQNMGGQLTPQQVVGNIVAKIRAKKEEKKNGRES